MFNHQKRVRLTRRDFLKMSSVLIGGAAAQATGVFEPVAASPSASASQTALGLTAQSVVKRIYLAADDHTDYMWTGNEAQYQAAFLEMIDYYLNLTDATLGNAPEHQSRWNCDGSFWMWTYEKNRTAAQFQRFINRLQSGHLSVPLNALVSCYGGAPAEAVLRGMYYPGKIERRYNLRFTLAVAMENQTLPYGLGSLWAGSGAKYSWRGVCGCSTKVSIPGLQNREHEIYWWAGPDGSKVLMKWYSLLGNTELGGYAEARNPSLAVDQATNKCGAANYPYDIAGAFGHGWDNLKTLTNSFVTTAQSKTNASRKVFVSNEHDFFEDFEATYGPGLPSLACTFGNEWDLYCASMAEVSARVKRAVEKLRGAEALATLVSLQNPGFMTSRIANRDQAWMNLGLYWEHNWTADGPISRSQRAAWQRGLATQIENYVNTLHGDAAVALGGLIQKTGANQRFYVFNPLSWTRTDVADFAYTGATPIHVVDLTTGLEAPSQLVTVDGQQYLRILAADVPPVGYKVFEIQPGSGSGFADAATVMGNVIENDFYQITVANRGAITSLIDKTRGNRQFVRNINGRDMNDLGPGSGTLQVENAGPVSVTLLATDSSPLAHTSRITLIRNSNRIDIRNDITQNFGDVRTWSFGFEINSPDVWHEEVGAVIRAKLLADGGHYSPVNARYDWLTLNHFADIGDGAVGATLSNADCYFMQLGNSTVNTLDTTTPQLSPLVGGQVDGSTLGIPNQDGDSQFRQRFALQTHDAYDPTVAMRFALEHQNPLIAFAVTGGSAYPETTFSLLAVSDPNALLWSLKPADDGISHGIVARLWNVSTNPINFSLSLSLLTVASAKRLTHIETPLEDATVTNGALAAALAASQIGTYSFITSLPAPTPNFPRNGDMAISRRPLFDWNNVPSATSYTLQIATSNTFASPLVNMPVTPSAYQLTSDLPANTLLFWRVRANSAFGSSAWSRTRHFMTPNPPNAPILMAPANGATLTTTPPTLDWSDSSPGVDHYEVQIAADPNFTLIARGHQMRVSISMFTPEAPLAASTTYHWRVRAVNAQGQFSQWSATRTFITPP